MTADAPISHAPTEVGEGSDGTADHTSLPRALLVFGSLERAGAQLRSLEVCAELDRQYGFPFEFCSIGLGRDELAEDLAARGAAASTVSIRSPRFFFDLARFIRQGGYEIVNAEPQLLSGIVLWIAWLLRIPTRIHTIHNTMGAPGQGATSPVARRILANRGFVALMRFLITRCATEVIAVSQSALDSVLPAPWAGRCRHRVIYNGTRSNQDRGSSDPRWLREEFGWPSDARVIVNVARFSEQKNHRTIVRTMALVRDRAPNARLLLVGTGILAPEIAESIEEAGLAEACAITSGRTDVPEILSASDVFFFPSAWEGLPGAPLEALAAGLPVVTSDIPSMREVATWFPNDVSIAAALEAAAHARNILDVLERPRDREAAARLFLRTPFVFERAVEAYRDVYGSGGGDRGA